MFSSLLMIGELHWWHSTLFLWWTVRDVKICHLNPFFNPWQLFLKLGLISAVKRLLCYVCPLCSRGLYTGVKKWRAPSAEPTNAMAKTSKYSCPMPPHLEVWWSSSLFFNHTVRPARKRAHEQGGVVLKVPSVLFLYRRMAWLYGVVWLYFILFIIIFLG